MRLVCWQLSNSWFSTGADCFIFPEGFCVALCHLVPDPSMSYSCISAMLALALSSVTLLPYTVAINGIGIHGWHFIWPWNTFFNIIDDQSTTSADCQSVNKPWPEPTLTQIYYVCSVRLNKWTEILSSDEHWLRMHSSEICKHCSSAAAEGTKNSNDFLTDWLNSFMTSQNDQSFKFTWYWMEVLVFSSQTISSYFKRNWKSFGCNWNCKMRLCCHGIYKNYDLSIAIFFLLIFFNFVKKYLWIRSLINKVNQVVPSLISCISNPVMFQLQSYCQSQNLI